MLFLLTTSGGYIEIVQRIVDTLRKHYQLIDFVIPNYANWTVTRTKKRRVTTKMKIARAASIARELNKTQKWHVHGHGISKDVLERDLNLLIDDFSADPSKGEQIREYHDLLSDYMAKTNTSGAIHRVGGIRALHVIIAVRGGRGCLSS